MYKIVWILFFFVSCNFSNEKKNITRIQFENSDLDVGNIDYKSNGKFQYKFQNIGIEPLRIESVTLSCSCLDAEFPKTPINPKDSGVIIIHTNTGRLGKFKERIAVHYNGTDSPFVLFLSGDLVFNKGNHHALTKDNHTIN
jgi:hypothetical protein